MNLLIETERAWAAGFFDGEGSVHYGNEPRRTPRVIVQVDQIDTRVLERFQAAVRVGRIRGPYTPNNPNAKPKWKYSVEGYDPSLLVYEAIGCYLDEVKRIQFTSAFSKYEAWTREPRCVKGHLMVPKKSTSKKAGFYCFTCFSENGKKRAEERWGSR